MFVPDEIVANLLKLVERARDSLAYFAPEDEDKGVELTLINTELTALKHKLEEVPQPDVALGMTNHHAFALRMLLGLDMDNIGISDNPGVHALLLDVLDKLGGSLGPLLGEKRKAYFKSMRAADAFGKQTGLVDKFNLTPEDA